jgi:adenylate kinase
LYQRDDDHPDSISVRLEIYERSTAPLIQFYANLRLLVNIDATGSPEEIYKRSIQALSARFPATASV